MNTRVQKMLGIEYPVVAFSHCRDVVAAVSANGGFGVLGAVGFSPEQLEIELSWIDDHAGGRPYGIDVVVAAGYDTGDGLSESERLEQYRSKIPERHREFVMDTAVKLGVPNLPDSEQGSPPHLRPHMWTVEAAMNLVEVALGHGVGLIANALGPPAPSIVDAGRSKGVPIAALVGTVRHAKKAVEAGADIIVAQGYEAGGHTGTIGTFVLVPEVVDAVQPIPVLAAGGVASGRQVAAALALGAEGVWTGSIWLTTLESDVEPEIVSRMLAASSTDTVRSQASTGKPVRKLRTAWTDAWESPDAPPTLPSPLQAVLVADVERSISRHRLNELADAPVGQVVGRMSERKAAGQLLYEMVQEYADVIGRWASAE